MAGCTNKGQTAGGADNDSLAVDSLDGAVAEVCDTTPQPVFLYYFDPDHMQVVYWTDAKEPDRAYYEKHDMSEYFADAHKAWEQFDAYRRNAAGYTQMLVGDMKSVPIRCIGEQLKNPDGEDLFPGELHSRKTIPSPGMKYALVNLKDSLRGELRLYRQANDAIVEERGLRNSQIAWMAGLQLYGLMDVFGILRHAKGRADDRKSIAATVVWSALVPGSGQIRNGEWGQAGLLDMAFIGSAVSFDERQKCVNWYRQRLRVVRAESSDEVSDLEERLSFFRKKRNQYVWGPILFYLYSIGDAVVDALLHDFDSPDHLAFAPELDPLGESFRMKLALDF